MSSGLTAFSFFILSVSPPPSHFILVIPLRVHSIPDIQPSLTHVRQNSFNNLNTLSSSVILGLPLLLPGEGLDLKTHKIAKILICKKKPDIAEKVEKKEYLRQHAVAPGKRTTHQNCTIKKIIVEQGQWLTIGLHILSDSRG